MLHVVSSLVEGFSLPTNTPGAEKNNVPSGATTKSLGVKETDHCFIVAEVPTAAVAGTLKRMTTPMRKTPIKIERGDDPPIPCLSKCCSASIPALPPVGSFRAAQGSLVRALWGPLWS